jgi:ubiquinone biosynthesis UbiH/UbiF/VisC/COQ6 family hydroxylase
LRAALIAHERPAIPLLDEAVLDARVYALSPGNVGFLREIGAWNEVAPGRRNAVHAMRIFGDAAAELNFDAYRAGVPELAWIVEDRVLQDALWRTLEKRDGIEIVMPARIESLELAPDRIGVRLDDGRRLEGRLLAGADGARSEVRRHAGIRAAQSDYGQVAVAANFACARAHENTAWQWFQGGAVLALLPLPGDRVSMIWSLPAEEARRAAALEPNELCRHLERATGGALGSFSLLTAPRSYDLRRLSAHRLVAPRVALLGDAAHVIHPLAGQGLNLGLQDVRALSELLVAAGSRRDPGEMRLLRRYERNRAEPILSMQLAVDGLFRLFSSESRLVSGLRNTGLNLADRMPVLKNILMRQAMS